MKLKAPRGAGDPCVAGVVVAARDGLYEVEAEIGALLMECFGFTEADACDRTPTQAAPGAANALRRRPPAKKTPA
jgi:hypothetical protein